MIEKSVTEYTLFLMPEHVNVANSSAIDEKLEKTYVAGLPGGFYKPISSPIKSMSVLSHQVKLNNGKTEVDLESIFLRLLMIGQKRQVDLEQLFAYELGAVPCALIDGFGCLRKSSKSPLVKRLGVVDISPRAASTVIVDVSQLFYHMVWPNGGSLADLISSIQARLDRYADCGKDTCVRQVQNLVSKRP